MLNLQKANKLKDKILTSSLLKDAQLSIFVMGIAGCGLIYQYLLASYSGRVIGVMEIAIFTIMTIMILCMGIGSFFVKKIKNKALGFSILESLISIVAVSSIYIISGAHALAYMLPEIIAQQFNIPIEQAPKYGFVSVLEDILEYSSYIVAAILGFLLGMEIPFLAAIREEVHGKHLDNNIGVIYGVDYFGAAIGATLWIMILIGMDVAQSLQITSFVNVLVGFFFILSFKKYVKRCNLALGVQIFTAFFIYFACQGITDWRKNLEQAFHRDPIVYSQNTKYQHFTVTEGRNSVSGEPIYSLYINKKTQFTSADESLYHSLLVYPTMIAAGEAKDVLIIGGGDGLALRDVLKFNPESVTIMDLDPALINFFKEPVYSEDGKFVNAQFIELNENAFNDERVNFVFGDAFLHVRDYARQNKKFDAIIVDLPDPSHPDLNKLYSKTFYKELHHLLNFNGAISIQSSSPQSSKEAFISIGKTLKSSGFHTQQYQRNIPSFNGQWGWTIGTKSLPMAKGRIASYEKLPVEDEWLTKSLLMATFEFGKNYYKNIDSIKVNTIDNNATYNYYQNAWNELERSVFE
tara:strand:- start:10135 stop:11868 length:1734 start_codon:yes stop_codon:yes gene_type:complete